jgi:hypothetical protein
VGNVGAGVTTKEKRLAELDAEIERLSDLAARPRIFVPAPDGVVPGRIEDPSSGMAEVAARAVANLRVALMVLPPDVRVELLRVAAEGLLPRLRRARRREHLPLRERRVSEPYRPLFSPMQDIPARIRALRDKLAGLYAMNESAAVREEVRRTIAEIAAAGELLREIQADNPRTDQAAPPSGAPPDRR